MAICSKMATFHIIGLFKVDISRESLALAAQHYEWADDWLTDTGDLTDEIWNWYIGERSEEMMTIALVEAQIKGNFSKDELLNMAHGESDQAPYLEFYLNGAGTEIISYEAAVKAEDRRICFFLHFVHPLEPIRIMQGKKIVEKLVLPNLTTPPERLRPHIHYLPYD
jgi:hypothetical protein